MGISLADGTYGWPTIPESLRAEPLILVDVDGTVRGDVMPMVRLARPMLPRVLRKATWKEPWNVHKLVHFSWNLGKLWTLRTVNREQRRRYKHLFSELHHLAAALLEDTPVNAFRARYRRCLPQMRQIWFDGAAALLRRLTQRAIVVLVTGSEQVQTEECVRLLSSRGVDTSRIFVHGSLYGYDPGEQRFIGKVQHLNVTLEGKRDAVRTFRHDASQCVTGAVGNSRPDRALFEAVRPAGLRILVCSRSVLQRRDKRTFVIRKFHRCGFRIVWDVNEYLAITNRSDDDFAQQESLPILATDCSYRNLLHSSELQRQWERLLEPIQQEGLGVSTGGRLSDEHAVAV
jgi:hypothetical protein